jgi:5-methylcytosine-specific restriction endonuclease McrA
MTGIQDKLLCLCLDSIYRKIGYKTVKDAIIALSSTDDHGEHKWFAFDIEYLRGKDEEWNFTEYSYANPVTWDEWVNLPIRPYDLTISSAKKEIRVPTVIATRHFCKVIIREPKLTKRNVRIRDKGICQYTNRQLKEREGNVDHVIPISRGGKNTWDNMVWCDKSINDKKKDKLPEEVGLKLIKKPSKPHATLISSFITERINHHTWKHFLFR